MKSITAMYYIDNLGFIARDIDKKYIPFVREKVLMKSMRRRIFSESDESLLKEIRGHGRAFEAL